jgi:cytochrome c peroxidase
MKITLILIFCIYSNLFANDITPIPENIEFDKKKATLGFELFTDARLSKDDSIACINCHNVFTNGADSQKISTGGFLNTPTIFNARYNFVQTFSGEAKTLQEHVHVAISNPHEMNYSMEEVVKKFRKIPQVVIKFNNVYKDGITAQNISDALLEFQKSLVTPNSPFDKYLKGDEDAIAEEQKDGYALFKDVGCISCHNGVNVGSNMYQKLGIMFAYKTQSNLKGRYEFTNKIKDIDYYKVPTLRNIEHTAPYLHDGSEENLDSVIKNMALNQLGVVLSSDQVHKIRLFLNSLTGEKPHFLQEMK